jgi:hypothetical protein
MDGMIGHSTRGWLRRRLAVQFSGLISQGSTDQIPDGVRDTGF